MIRGFILLLLCQLAGELIARSLDVPVPGGVIGMLLLFIGLLLYRGVPEELEQASQGVLKHLALYFVPASVGIMTMGPLLAQEGVRIGVVMVLSTLIPLLACGYLLDRWLAKRGLA
ncbi:MAG: CidA/LrgA family protein [Pseudomonadota bacterium]